MDRPSPYLLTTDQGGAEIIPMINISPRLLRIVIIGLFQRFAKIIISSKEIKNHSHQVGLCYDSMMLKGQKLPFRFMTICI